jgi:hypothetical protein
MIDGDYTDPDAVGCIIGITMKHGPGRTDRGRSSDRRSSRCRAFCLLAPLLAFGAALAPSSTAQPSFEAAPLPAPFSAGKPGAELPRGWEPVKLSANKTPTDYALVEDGDAVVLHAKAIAAASGLAQFTVFDVRSAPVVEWRWKASSLVDGADNRVAAKEDAPARLLLAFDGDKSQLPLVERAVFYIAEKLSGRPLPYALLQYVWARRLPVGTVIEHPYTRRVRMIVVASGAGGVGKWQSFSRNVYDDYRHAFDEEPGELTGIGVMTDTDNTRGSVEAWYGDIRFRFADR